MAENININKPAPFIESAGITLTERLMPFLNPANATNTASYATQVANQNSLQQQALQQQLSSAGLGQATFDPTTGGLSGVGQGTGIGAYEPFLSQAGTDAAASQNLTGPNAYKDFMSPYQQEVIDTSLAAMERERSKGRQQIGDNAFQVGAFGGGRQGAQEGEYDAMTAMNLAQLEASLNQQNFSQAQQQAQQSFGNQQTLSANQQGLAQLAPQLAQQQAANLGQLGQTQQLQNQAILDAQRDAAREAAFESQQRVGFTGQQLTGLIGGYPASAGYQTTTSPGNSPLQNILGVAGIGGGIYGALNNQ